MMETIGHIVSLQIGRPKDELYSGVSLTTAINKRRVNTLNVMSEGIVGDEVGNKKYHGGPDRVICFYPYENYEKWEKKLGSKLEIPGFGENITVKGLEEENVYIGDIYRIGDCIIQISQGRIPCSTISIFNTQPPLLKGVLETCLTGYFARIIKPGIIQENDEMILEIRVQEDVNILYGNRVILHGQDGIEGINRLLSIPELSEEWKEILVKKRNKSKAGN